MNVRQSKAVKIKCSPGRIKQNQPQSSFRCVFLCFRDHRAVGRIHHREEVSNHLGTEEAKGWGEEGGGGLGIGLP